MRQKESLSYESKPAQSKIKLINVASPIYWGYSTHLLNPHCFKTWGKP